MQRHYIDRMLSAKDPRLQRLGRKLAYGRADMVATPEPKPIRDEAAELRAEYHAIFGKRPFMGWPADKLREMIRNAK